MKSAITNMSDDKAVAELRNFKSLALVLSLLGVAFWVASILGLAFGGRSLLLTYHKANKDNASARYLSVLTIILSIAGLARHLFFR